MCLSLCVQEMLRKNDIFSHVLLTFRDVYGLKFKIHVLWALHKHDTFTCSLNITTKFQINFAQLDVINRTMQRLEYSNCFKKVNGPAAENTVPGPVSEIDDWLIIIG